MTGSGGFGQDPSTPVLEPGGSEAGCSEPRRKLWDPRNALIAAAILLPVILFSLAAWQSYREALHQIEARVERTVLILEEHAVKAFETHRLVIQQVNGRLRFVDWSRESDRAELHQLLKRLQDELDQIATIVVTDREGRLLASSRTYPADRSLSYADRDWFPVVRQGETTLPYVSRSYTGRQSGLAVFNVVGRMHVKPEDGFEGAVSVSVDRSYFEHFYESIETTFDHSVVLVREDGAILAHAPSIDGTQMPPGSLLLQHISLARSGSYTGVSLIDGVERISAYRNVGGYPVYVRFGISKHAALAPWRQSLLGYGLVAALASLALIGVSLLALRQTDRERLARRRWEETAAALQQEASQRNRVEEQLRQAQKMEAVGRLTGGVAHDFNNLLTAVIGSLDLVRHRADKIDDKNIALVTNALEGAQRAAALTSRLLAFSRQQPLQPARIDANELVGGMSDLLRRTLGETVRIETIFAKDLWPVIADPNQLESAVVNLAVNARDAMPDGGTLKIETSNVHLDAHYAATRSEVSAGDYVITAVSDTGSGMAPDVIANIFEPFFTTKPAGKGTGLGLSQVYGFVKQSGGHVSVHSDLGRGTIFKLYLPRLSSDAESAERAKPALRAVEPSHRSAGNGETIVVVEDEAMVRELSVLALEEAGYRVLAASDGASGLNLLRNEDNVALLFTDIVLGGPMNGRMLADVIREERPDLPVLFTTGYTRDALFHRGRLDRGAAFIRKPFTSASLVAKVDSLLVAQNHGSRALASL